MRNAPPGAFLMALCVDAVLRTFQGRPSLVEGGHGRHGFWPLAGAQELGGERAVLQGRALLLPPAALATDWPLRQRGAEGTGWLVAWQATSLLVCLLVVALDRWWPALRGREDVLYAFCAAFIAQCAWIGVFDGHWRGDYSIWAAGLTFGAAVAGTPLRIRRPLYAAKLFALAVPAWQRTGVTRR